MYRCLRLHSSSEHNAGTSGRVSVLVLSMPKAPINYLDDDENDERGYTLRVEGECLRKIPRALSRMGNRLFLSSRRQQWRRHRRAYVRRRLCQSAGDLRFSGIFGITSFFPRRENVSGRRVKRWSKSFFPDVGVIKSFFCRTSSTRAKMGSHSSFLLPA